jgi:hypothetical protein
VSELFVKAVRSKVPIKVALIGPSGGGKTYSSLLMAKGIGGKWVLIDTENKRSLHYADEFDFLHYDFQPPFGPERFVALIKKAEAAGLNIIIDSASHEWIGQGGCLELKAMIDQRPGSNSYTNWAKITPLHEAFLECIRRCNTHLILNLRGKDEYVLENQNGKNVPKKVGMGPQMRDGIEYECTVALTLDVETHVASCFKDNTKDEKGVPIFDGKMQKITEEHGIKLKQWANNEKGEQK